MRGERFEYASSRARKSSLAINNVAEQTVSPGQSGLAALLVPAVEQVRAVEGEQPAGIVEPAIGDDARRTQRLDVDCGETRGLGDCAGLLPCPARARQ